MKRATITVDEWAEALADAKLAGRRSDPGETTQELAARFGVSRRTMHDRLAVLRRAGRVTVGTRYVGSGSGRVPVYRLLPAKR
jgi:DNA-binding FadR family transcriptional regulator